MLEQLEQYQGTISVVVAVVFCLNIGLSALKMILEKVKDMTSSELDNKIYLVVCKVAVILGKVADWASANLEHKKKPE